MVLGGSLEGSRAPRDPHGPPKDPPGTSKDPPGTPQGPPGPPKDPPRTPQDPKKCLKNQRFPPSLPASKGDREMEGLSGLLWEHLGTRWEHPGAICVRC